MTHHTLYHISPARNRHSIHTTGLRIGTIGGPYVWLFPGRETAERYLHASWDLSNGQNDLWAVDVTGLNIEDDPDAAFRDTTSYVVTEPVPAGRVELVVAAELN